MEYSTIETPQSDFLLYVVDDFSHDFPNHCFTFCCEDMENRASDHVHCCELRCRLPIVPRLVRENTYDRFDNVVPLYRLTGVAGHAIFLPSSSARARARNSPIQFGAASCVRETMAPISGGRRHFLSSRPIYWQFTDNPHALIPNIIGALPPSSAPLSRSRLPRPCPHRPYAGTTRRALAIEQWRECGPGPCFRIRMERPPGAFRFWGPRRRSANRARRISPRYSPSLSRKRTPQP
jgi:hypothetical protein